MKHPLQAIPLLTHDEAIKRARQVLKIESEALALTGRDLDENFATAIDLLLATLERRGKIVITGVGKNLPIAEKICATLSSTGAPSVLLNPMQAMHGDLGLLNSEDALLALSFSGASEELLTLLPAVRRLNLPIIGISGDLHSPLARFCDVLLKVTIEREACPFNMAPTASTTATLALGDALAMVLLDARGFQREQYACLHPAGAIGRALLMRVGDIMRTGERLARLPLGATVQDALVAMTHARVGAACIVDDQGLLAGIFTDGDLRRRLARGAEALNLPLREAMTADPIRVNIEQLAVDVLRLFELHKIDDLPVVDGAGKLVGYVDIQDLPRLKII